MFVANRIMKGRSEKVQDHNDHEENETHTTEVHSAVLVGFLSGVTLQSLSIRSDMVRSHIDSIVEFMEDLILLLDFVSHHVGMVLVIECSAMQPSVQLALTHRFQDGVDLLLVLFIDLKRRLLLLRHLLLGVFNSILNVQSIYLSNNTFFPTLVVRHWGSW